MGKKWRYINDRYVYKPKLKLGQGGNATVYIARIAKEKESKEFALKILDDSPNNFSEKIERFKIETELVMSIQNEINGVIPIYDFNFKENESEKFWYIMPLATPINEHFTYDTSIDEKVKCIIEISRVMTQLHRKDIVHRDIKPSNIYFYDNSYALSDFGLVDYPEKSDLTRIGEPIGAKATIAPEMKIDAINADGKKADVYSLAKTLWMLLVGKDYAFEGTYNPESELMGLRKFYKSMHLVELEQLLIDSTLDNPYLRPSIEEFSQRLIGWSNIYNDFKRSNLSQWRYIQERLFVKAIPKIAAWDDIDDIITVLNLLGSMPNLNHMFIPSGGGQDLDNAERATEVGCIRLKCGGGYYIIKPKRLIVESIDKDFMWSYFRLELDNLNPIFSTDDNQMRELLTEDLPGHYISWKNGNYGYYDDGSKLPGGYNLVDRFLQGSFVFFSKASVYNDIAGTYDARHNKMDAEKYRAYIEQMKKDYTGIDFDHFYSKYNQDTLREEIQQSNNQDEIDFINYERVIEFVNKNYKTWDFSSICGRFQGSPNENVVFSLQFNFTVSDFFSPTLYISEKGNIEEDQKKLYLYTYTSDDRFIFGKFEDAVCAIKEMESYIQYECEQKGLLWEENIIYFSIKLHKIKSPAHLFTKTELEAELRNGDDSKHNTLVIDSNGYFKLVEDDEYIKQRYPVRHESFNAYNNYVGQYSSLNHLDDTYLSSLQGWLRYLKTGKSQYISYISENSNEVELINSIKEYME
ncbi:MULTISPECIES: protein kinase domain-containing protein [Niallia]|jgi:serine/threonine protein kinase|uniref:protein kinase domain-containing protein n=1 Tax=Niallia TaxID=2837506 RepID=UPI0013D32C17|nr:protein kinase [Niallia circulans]QJX60751.1 protein kinase [Niallia circulans]